MNLRFVPLSICALACSLLAPALSAQASFKILYTFTDPSDIQNAGPVEVARGVFVGAANVIYRITSNGDYSTLAGAQGFNGAVFPADNGLLYGGAGSQGYFSSAFSISPLGALQVYPNEVFFAYPQFIEARDGTLVGFTQVSVMGTPETQIYSLSLNGLLTPIVTGGGLGFTPAAAPIQASDRNFYEPFILEGQDGSYEIQRISPQGVITTIYTGYDETKGAFPSGPLLEVNGVLYGECLYGALDIVAPDTGDGIIFSITPAGTFHIVHVFKGGALGANPQGGLILASDGDLYGTTQSGAIFRLSPDGSSYSVVYQLSGFGPSFAPFLTQGSDGKLYGVGDGSFFQLDLGLPAPRPTVAYFSPASASPGETVKIRGTQLLGVRAVSFNGTPAASIESEGVDYVSAVVPAGASTGPVIVTTPNGSAVSPERFVVR